MGWRCGFGKGERGLRGKRGPVEATRKNRGHVLVLLTTKDAENTEAPLVSGPGSGRAVVVKGAGGRVSSLLHHAHEEAASLNYKRALATLLTPVHHDSDFKYYSQADVLGSCEVHYEKKGLKTMTWRDLTQCSHFTSEMVLGAHSLPLLHLYNLSRVSKVRQDMCPPAALQVTQREISEPSLSASMRGCRLCAG
ncbi:uncharacterized protein LOC119585531 [Penaeus monodon]|uniref:uncharacterized protein LOC119585531 n=1 Tax=Penaeus monodon TaxID=6687 RepID=UPI0018A6D803|nr:uncharacterized protein LOC119585531 [Penaeus monodon]